MTLEETLGTQTNRFFREYELSNYWMPGGSRGRFPDTWRATFHRTNWPVGLVMPVDSHVEQGVFRKLSTLPYRSSYSHCGAYCTLDSIARFDDLGLWSYQDIHFSRQGTLLNTAVTLVRQAPAGCFADELEVVVHVAVKDPLRQLVQAGRLYRRELTGSYLYCAMDRARRQEQWAARQTQQQQGDDVLAAKSLFYGLLDEQQRRLYAGLESLHFGHGGDQRMAQTFGLDVDTIARGRSELLSAQVVGGRIRRSGGGRPAVEKKRPKS